jgi:hypothetical protein
MREFCDTAFLYCICTVYNLFDLAVGLLYFRMKIGITVNRLFEVFPCLRNERLELLCLPADSLQTEWQVF